MSQGNAEDKNGSEDTDSRLGLSFIIVSDLEPLDTGAVIASGATYGLALSISPPSNDDLDPAQDANEEGADITSFDLAGGQTVFVMLMPIPHPDVKEMARGPLSPDDMDSVINGIGHYIVTVTGLEGTVDEVDIKMSAITASLMAGCKPLGVLKMPGVLFHRPDLFASCAKEAVESNRLPMLISVDITAAQENDSHMSFLTHNLQRYGREEFYVVAPSEGKGALDYVINLIQWMLNERDYHLPTGDTVGRTADEKIIVQRVPNPTGEGADVIRLEIP